MENKQKNNLCDTNSCMDIKVLEEKYEKKKLKLHFIYVAIILVALLIAVAVINTTLTGSILAHIATVTSIILSVLAIFITVLANDSTNNLLHRIRDIADNLGKLPKHIAENIKKLDDSTAKLDKIDNLDKITQLDQLTKLDALQKLDRLKELDKLKDLTAIIEKLQKIEEDIKSQRGSLSTLGSNFEKILGANQKEDSKTTELNDSLRIADDVVESFLAKTSKVGTQLIYTMFLLNERNKRLNLEKLSSVILDYYKQPSENLIKYKNYLHGFYVCLTSIPSLFILEDDTLDVDKLVVKSVHPYIKNNILKQKQIDEKFKSLIDKFVADSPSIDDSSNEEEKK